MAIPKQRKIKGKNNFAEIFAARKVLVGKFLRLHFDFSSTSGSKFAVVTTKKVGKAFVRNNFRRIIYNYLRSSELYRDKPNIRVVVFCKPELKDISDPNLILVELEELMKKIRL